MRNFFCFCYLRRVISEDFLLLSGILVRKLFSRFIYKNDPDIYQQDHGHEKEPERDLLDPHLLRVEPIPRVFSSRFYRRGRNLLIITRYPDPGIIEIVHETLVNIETRYERQSK